MSQALSSGGRATAPDAASSVHRFGLLETRSDRELLTEALSTRDASLVKSIRDFSLASGAQKVELLDIVTKQEWRGPVDRVARDILLRQLSPRERVRAALRINDAFVTGELEAADAGWASPQEAGRLIPLLLDLPALARADWWKVRENVAFAAFDVMGNAIAGFFDEEPDLFEKAESMGVQLSNLRVVDYFQQRFRHDTRATALRFLQQNRTSIAEEREKFRAGQQPGRHGSEDVQKQLEERVAHMRLILEQALIAQRSQLALQKIQVGWTWRYEGMSPRQVPAHFRPSGPPPIVPLLPGNTPPLAWGKVKEAHDKFQMAIDAAQVASPAASALMRRRMLAPLAADPDLVPDAMVIEMIGSSLAEIDAKAVQTIEMITSGDIDDRDLKPVHKLLLAADEPGTHAWNEPFFEWVAKSELRDFEDSEWWTSLGLSLLAAAAMIAAPFTGGLTALVAAGLIGHEVGSAWEKYVDFDVASQAEVDPRYEVVSDAQREAALVSALLASAFAVLDVVEIGALAKGMMKGLSATGKELSEQTTKQLADGAAEAGHLVDELADTVPAGALADTVPAGALDDTVPAGALDDTVPAGALDDTVPAGALDDTVPAGGGGSGGGRGGGSGGGRGGGRRRRDTLPGVGPEPPRPAAPRPEPFPSGRPRRPGEAGRWWTDGQQVYEAVDGKWVPRGRLPERPNFRNVSFDELRVRNGRLEVRRGGQWVDEGPYPASLPRQFHPGDTIRGEVRLNADRGRWEVKVDDHWYDLGPAPELPEWARRPRGGGAPDGDGPSGRGGGGGAPDGDGGSTPKQSAADDAVPDGDSRPTKELNASDGRSTAKQSAADDVVPPHAAETMKLEPPVTHVKGLDSRSYPHVLFTDPERARAAYHDWIAANRDVEVGLAENVATGQLLVVKGEADHVPAVGGKWRMLRHHHPGTAKSGNPLYDQVVREGGSAIRGKVVPSSEDLDLFLEDVISRNLRRHTIDVANGEFEVIIEWLPESAAPLRITGPFGPNGSTDVWDLSAPSGFFKERAAFMGVESGSGKLLDLWTLAVKTTRRRR